MLLGIKPVEWGQQEREEEEAEQDDFRESLSQPKQLWYMTKYKVCPALEAREQGFVLSVIAHCRSRERVQHQQKLHSGTMSKGSPEKGAGINASIFS